MTRADVVFDSSAWIELLGGGPLASRCEEELSRAATVIVPTVVLFEVYRKVRRSVSEEEGLRVVGLLSQHHVEELTLEVALEAADLSLAHQLAMADSIVLGHARRHNALLVTLDNDFAELSGTRVIRGRH